MIADYLTALPGVVVFGLALGVWVPLLRQGPIKMAHIISTARALRRAECGPRPIRDKAPYRGNWVTGSWVI